VAVLVCVHLASAQPALMRTAEPAGDLTVTGIAYAPAEPAGSKGHLLDLYLPPGVRHPLPLVIWSHGSAWASENGRSGAEVVAAELNPRGYAVAGVAVRSNSFVHFPAQLYDVKAAVRFLRANAGRYHLDPTRFAIMGESSGGWVAAMAAMTGGIPDLEGNVGGAGQSSRLQAAVAIYSPTDFLRMDASMHPRCLPVQHAFHSGDCHSDAGSPESKLLGCAVSACPDAAAKADPNRYASRHGPPVLLLHGQRDPLVPWQQSALLYQALRAVCGDVALALLPHGGHGQWQQFLTDRAVNADATVESSTRCRDTEARPVTLGWAYLIRFFDRTLHIHRP
jgi:acetyl esterase/lipase